ncbi:MAG: 3-phosphoshikimate 1-carboxyvinyltransferase [Bacteroidetes Order II. Incertae sedis bacterium]|nr:3-phosphoshikimate 1-carboxyvinyltransferase [Bacteroidetes Order II. bacterium]
MSQSPKATRIIQPSRGLVGSVELPPDKSIAHRAALFSALADGTSHIVGFPEAEDPQSTLACLRQLGIRIEDTETGLAIHGKGLHGLKASDTPLDCGNSGTTMRLLSGILAGQPFSSTLVGDASLSVRPMGRITDPLRLMNAEIDSTEGHAPLHIRAAYPLKAMEYPLPVASAQVKSCVLLAGLFAKGTTTIIEDIPSRDHTERMLGLSSFTVGSAKHISIDGDFSILPRMWSIPADFSAAAFFLVAGCILPDTALHLPRVGLNPSRTGLLDVLRAMGADIQIRNERVVSGETLADLDVRTSALNGLEVKGDIVANIIDEIPILCVAAALAEGTTHIKDATELRHKETDRIRAMVDGLSALGVQVTEQEDGLEITGGTSLSGGDVSSFGDHRIAMSMAIAGLAASEPVRIEGSQAASISYPGFWDTLERLR